MTDEEILIEAQKIKDKFKIGDHVIYLEDHGATVPTTKGALSWPNDIVGRVVDFETFVRISPVVEFPYYYHQSGWDKSSGEPYPQVKGPHVWRILHPELLSVVTADHLDKPCEHPEHKLKIEKPCSLVRIQGKDVFHGAQIYTCECGVKLKPKEFEEVT